MEPFESLVARVKATAYCVDFVEKPARVRFAGGKHPVTRKVERMSQEQLALLLALLEGRAWLTSVRGETYVLMRSGAAWTVAAENGTVIHTVLDGACSCEDARFRGRRCKHLEAVDTLSGGAR